jgi:hypothetical protein
MAVVIYSLCALVALACACLLLRAWRVSRHRLLFWSGLCFAALAVNNVLLFLDKIMLPTVDLSLPRTLVAVAGLSVMLYGLVWESR